MIALQPLLFLEEEQDGCHADHHRGEGENIAVAPREFRHKLEVHTVDGRYERRRHEYNRNDGEYLDYLVLLDVYETEERVLQVVQTVETEVGVLYQGVDVLDYHAELRLEVAREQVAAEHVAHHALLVYDVLAYQHCLFLQFLDVDKHIVIDFLLFQCGRKR